MPAHAQSASILSNSMQMENASSHVGLRKSMTAQRKVVLSAPITAKTAQLSTLARYAAIHSLWKMENASRVKKVTTSIR
jgi:hypothetical protein